MKQSIQLLLARKSLDPTALTARDAIRSLLGYGDTLRELHRREVFELELEGSETEAIRAAVEDHLVRSVSFWNPNRERCWVRIDGPGACSWEGGRGLAGAPFGEPECGQAQFDHLLIWSSTLAANPDLPALPPSARWLKARRAELYTFRWGGDPDAAERRRHLAGVAVAKSRGQGLLVQPHYQEHRLVSGALPIPIWERTTDALH